MSSFFSNMPILEIKIQLLKYFKKEKKCIEIITNKQKNIKIYKKPSNEKNFVELLP